MENYVTFAKKLAEDSGEIALRYFGFDVEKTWKSDDSPLTQADTEINSFVIRQISTSFPEHSIIGEEDSKKVDRSKYAWVCDPIDGTMPFSCGLPLFTFSIALVDQSNGLPVVGVVYDPILKNMYWASKGAGAFRNGKKISVCKDTNLKNTYVNMEGSGKNIASVNFSNIDTLTALREKGIKNYKFLSIIYGAVQVANGKFSGSIFFGVHGHDVASTKIIIEEAGGKVTDLLGNERRYDEKGLGCVASNGLLHSELLSCIKKI